MEVENGSLQYSFPLMYGDFPLPWIWEKGYIVYTLPETIKSPLRFSMVGWDEVLNLLLGMAYFQRLCFVSGSVRCEKWIHLMKLHSWVTYVRLLYLYYIPEVYSPIWVCLIPELHQSVIGEPPSMWSIVGSPDSKNTKITPYRHCFCRLWILQDVSWQKKTFRECILDELLLSTFDVCDERWAYNLYDHCQWMQGSLPVTETDRFRRWCDTHPKENTADVVWRIPDANHKSIIVSQISNIELNTNGSVETDAVGQQLPLADVQHVAWEEGIFSKWWTEVLLQPPLLFWCVLTRRNTSWIWWTVVGPDWSFQFEQSC